MEDWINLQCAKKISEWSIATSSSTEAETWHKADAHYKFITEQANTLKAVKLLNWNELLDGLGADQVVVDLGCGTGWLSAYLSTFPQISKIICIDSDQQMLESMVPNMFDFMAGNFDKAECVHGLFEPILLEDKSVDLIVACAAFHHSENLPGLLSEVRRVLKQNGLLVILNENPLAKWEYLYIWFRKILHMTVKILTGHIDDKFQKISHVAILYDPILGDWDFSRAAWRAYLSRAGFNFKEVDTGLGPYKFRKNRHTLKHFICRPK
jgi:ubiquinone/menaquinone biosynthesis C-methylase UbiE